jgi:hypothetical protein
MAHEQRPSSRTAAALALALILLGAGPAVAGEWRYVLPTPGDPFEHPPLRALALSRERPDDVKEMVRYRGKRQRYAQLRYGSPGSVRITVVLDEAGPGDVDLYVDADRNRRIEAKDLVAVKDRTWRLPMGVAIVEGEVTNLTPRAAVFRLGATGLTFSFAAAGYLEGTVKVAGREHAARRLDGDGNGFLTDAQDRLWIDLDDDGQWDASREQFLFSTILPIGEARYALRSDELGRRLSIETLEGAGTAKLALKRPPGAAKVAEVNATLIGRDGSAVGLVGEGTEATVPVGEYRVGTLTVTLDDPEGGPRWSFVFSDMEGKPDRTWYKVEKGGLIEIDPIGTLELLAGVDPTEAAKAHRGGDDVPLQPKLYTGGGLLICTCFRGSPTTPGGHDGPGAEIKLTSTDGLTLTAARSGFA